MTFKEAVDQTPNLENTWKKGLQALRNEDKVHITAEDTKKLMGSVDIDGALMRAEPNSNRWDYAIGYKRNIAEHIYWIELHSAYDSEVTLVLNKFEWLKNWLKNNGKCLATFECTYMWISSGATHFTPNSRQARRLAESGLQHSGRIRIQG